MRRNSEVVRDFHRMVGEPPLAAPVVPDARVLGLRRALIAEEYREVLEVFERILATRGGEDANPASLAPLAHELADLLYVTYGSMIACGVDPDQVFAEVHRANMHKASGPKREDGKQMKPPDWKPADVQAVLAAQRQRGGASVESGA